MFVSHVYNSAVSIGDNASNGKDDITLSQETRNQRVDSKGDATISQSTLLKGLKAREAIIVKNDTKIQGDTESIMGGITANDSIFQDIRSREKIKMNNCTVEDVSVSMDGCSATNSTIRNLEVREKAQLENCIVSNRIKVSMTDLTWDNDISYKEKFQCKSIEARGAITLKNISANFVKSSMDKVITTNCKLEDVEARNEATLIDTSAQKVEVSMGPLQVTAQSQMLTPYQNLKARENIVLSNIEAFNVRSDMGTILAEKCVLGSIEGNQSIKIQQSIVNQSITLKVNSSQPCRLLLEGSIIKGNIIIEACINEGSTFISSERVSTKISIGRFSVSDVAINTGGNYHSISDIPSNIKSMALMSAKENQKVAVGNLECVVKNGTLELAQQKPLTFEELKKQIGRAIGFGATCSHLEFNGGIYKVTNGNIEIIQAPPGLVMNSELETSTTNLMPNVSVEISGGKVEGKVIFKNCQGKVKLLDHAVVETQ
jgi:hypothetical protein